MKKRVLVLAIFLSINMPVFADEVQQTITLKDGSQIKGVLAGIDNGVYTVKTPIIGDVHVSASDVASITNGNAAAAALPAGNPGALAGVAPASAPATNLDQQIASAQQRLVSDPQSMAMLQQMAQNPEIAQTLQDPALIQAVRSHDYQAVQASPAVQKLMSDPQMQAILQKLAGQQQQQNSSSQ